MNFRVDRRGHREPPRTALTSRAERASEQAGCLAGRRGTARGTLRRWGTPAAAAGEGGVRLIRAATEGRKSERDRASARARGSGIARRDATRHAEPRRAAPRRARGNMAHRSSGNIAARPSRTPADPTNTHGRTENGGPEKERIPFCRADGDEKRWIENERTRD